jgi:putative ABC transport system permease protein
MIAAIPIGIFELVLAAGLLLINILLSVILRLRLAGSLLVAAIRMVVQLALVGLVLEWIFATRNPAGIVGMAAVMAALASIAAVRRTRRRFPGVYWNSLVTITASSFLVTGFTLSVVVRPDPWFDPQYLIPLHGMLLGNALTGISLGLDRFTEYCVDRRSRIEALLALGATRWEAAIEPIRDALRTGLVPTLNSMAIMGIVSLPGMMTGQILAGADPGVAVRYQIMIMFMIASCVALATTGVVFLAFLKLFSARHELRIDRLK